MHYDPIPRKLLAVFAAFIAAFIIGGIIYFQWFKEYLVAKAFSDLSLIADMKATQIALWRNEIWREAEYVQKNPFIGGYVLKFRASGGKDAEIKDDILLWLKNIGLKHNYEGVILLDTNGERLLSFADQNVDFGSVAKLVKDGIKASKPAVLDIYRDETGNIHFDMVASIREHGRDDGKPAGFIGLFVDPGRYLFPLIQSWPTNSKTAETLLVKADGNEIVFINELRHKKSTALNFKIPFGSREDLPAERLLKGYEGVMRGVDYRGVPVLAATKRIVDTNWGVVAKVDVSEIYGPLYERTILLSLLILVSISCTVAIIMFIWRSANARYYFERLEEKKRMDKALESAYGELELKVAQRTQELLDKNTELRAQIAEKEHAEKQTRMTNELLSLVNQTYTRSDYLNMAVAKLRKWTVCECIGVRLMNEEGDIPYEAYIGFSKEHWESECWLNIHKDQCTCIRVITGEAAPEEMKALTPGGSFCSNNFIRFINDISNESGTRFRGACVKEGFATLAVIPIRFKEKVIGAIHMADRREGALPPKTVELVEGIVPIIGEAVKRIEMEENIKRQYQKQSIIQSLLELSIKGETVNGILNRALDGLFREKWLDLDGAGRIYLASPESQKLILKCSIGVSDDEAQRCREIPFGVCACGRSFLNSSIELAGAVAEDPIGPSCGLCVPIVYRNNAIGLMNLCMKPGYKRNKRKDEFMMTLGVTLGNIISNIRSEEDLLQANKVLSDTKRLSDIGSLAATVAHELRNPLGVILSAMYNIKRKNKDPALGKHLANIDAKVAESSQIITNLLFYSRIKKPHREPTDIVGLLEECIAQAEERFEKQEVKLESRLMLLSGRMMNVDAFQMKEVFMNVLTNAYNALPSSGGRLVVEGRYDGSRVRISICDNGCGIANEDLKHVFEPFFTLKSKGTGLGLAICKELVGLHSGEIKIESELGKGTTVSVELPHENTPL